MRRQALRATTGGRAVLAKGAVAGAGLALLLASGLPAALAQDDPGATTTVAPTTQAPTTEAPATTEVPATTAPDEDPVSPLDDESSGLGIDWGTVLRVVLVVAVAVVALAIILGASQRRARESRAFNRRLAEVVGRVQWIHDEGSLEVLGATSSPERLEAVWEDTRRRINDVSAQASALATSSPGTGARDELRYLSSTLGRLTGALDTHVSLHMQLSGDPSLATALEGASETVMQRRADVNRAIGPLSARI